MTDSDLRKQLIRNLHEVVLERQLRAPLYDTRCAGVTNPQVATQLGAGYDEVAPGMRSCPYHYHLAEEEMFVVLEGEGTLRVAGRMLPLKQGDVITIPPGPAYPHQLINTSTALLKYLSISTRVRPEVCVYPDSDKVAAFHDGVQVLQRRGQALDYWDGEP